MPKRSGTAIAWFRQACLTGQSAQTAFASRFDRVVPSKKMSGPMSAQAACSVHGAGVNGLVAMSVTAILLSR